LDACSDNAKGLVKKGDKEVMVITFAHFNKKFQHVISSKRNRAAKFMKVDVELETSARILEKRGSNVANKGRR